VKNNAKGSAHKTNLIELVYCICLISIVTKNRLVDYTLIGNNW